MGLYKIDKNIFLPDGKSIIIDIDIPFNGELDEEKDYSFIEETIIDGLYNGSKKAIDCYQASELPNKFIKRQNFFITNNIPNILLGVCDESGDIYLDADAIQGIRYVSAEFLLAHEVGHKILRYIDKNRVYKDIADVLGIDVDNFQIFLTETFANACGNIASGLECYDFLGERFSIEATQSEEIKRRTLYNIYRS